MNCSEYEMSVSAYADGELGGHERLEFEAHVGQCLSCKRLLEQTMRLQREISDVLMDCSEVTDLVSLVMGRIRPRSRARFTWVWAAAATLLLLTAGSIPLLQRASEREHAPVAVVTPERKPAAEQRTVALPSGRRTPKERVVSGTGSRSAGSPSAAKVSFGTEVPKHRLHRAAAAVTGDGRKTPGEGIPARDQDAYQVAAEKAEIAVEYTNSAPAALRAVDLATVLSAEAPVTGHGQQAVTEMQTVIENGRRVEMMCYRIIDKSSGTD